MAPPEFPVTLSHPDLIDRLFIAHDDVPGSLSRLSRSTCSRRSIHRRRIGEIVAHEAPHRMRHARLPDLSTIVVEIGATIVAAGNNLVGWEIIDPIVAVTYR